MAVSDSRRTPISLPTYKLGDEGKTHHFIADTSRETAAKKVEALEVGDAAFVLRSDRKWAYSILDEKKAEVDGSTTLNFILDKERYHKRFPQKVWGKYLRVIEVDDDELKKLEKEADAKAKEMVETVLSVETLEPKTQETTATAEKEEVLAPNKDETGAAVEKDGTKEDATEAKHEDGDNAPWSAMTSGVGAILSDYITTANTASAEIYNGLAKKLDEKKKEFDEKMKEVENNTIKAKKEENTDKTSSSKGESAIVAPQWLASLFDGKKKETKATESTKTTDEEREPTDEDRVPEMAPIKLLQTPITFYKAPSMKEDPAALAIAATSFADDVEYTSLTKHGAVVVENDPSAAALAEELEKERLYGNLEKQGIIVVETCLSDGCSVATYAASPVAAADVAASE